MSSCGVKHVNMTHYITKKKLKCDDECSWVRVTYGVGSSSFPGWVLCIYMYSPKNHHQAALSKTADYDSALAAIASGLHLVVLEQIESSASLHGTSVANHHVCLLVKSAVSSPSI